jgi:hypothetical protein
MYTAQGIFQHNFKCKKVHTILDKIRYLTTQAMTKFFCNFFVASFPQLFILEMYDGLSNDCTFFVRFLNLKFSEWLILDMFNRLDNDFKFFIYDILYEIFLYN